MWFNYTLGLNFICLCFKVIIVHYHTQEQRKMKFKPSLKLNFCLPLRYLSCRAVIVYNESRWKVDHDCKVVHSGREREGKSKQSEHVSTSWNLRCCYVLCPRLGCATDEPKPLVEMTASKRRNPYSESSYIVFPPSSFLLFLLFSQTGYLDFHFGLILAISAWFWPFWDVLGLFGLSFLLNNLSVKTVKMKGAGEGKQLKWRGGGERKTIKNEEEEEEGKQ